MSWKAAYGQRFLRWSRVSSMKLTRRYIQPDLIEMAEDNLTVKYITDTYHEDDTVGAGISESPLMPLPIGDVPTHAYFEMRVVNAGEYGYVSIGVAADGFPIARAQPGWRKASCGYHGDDGDLYCGTGFGTHYGETYTTNNVVGCLFDLTTRSVTFVRQGQALPMIVPYETTEIPMFAVCGTHSENEEIKLNFGLDPFEFDVASHIAQKQAELTDEQLQETATKISEITEKLLAYSSTTNDDGPDQVWSEEATPFTDLLRQLAAPGAETNEILLKTLRGMLEQAGWPTESLQDASPTVLINLGKVVLLALAQSEQLGELDSDEDDDMDDEEMEFESGEEGEEDDEDDHDSNSEE